MENVMEQPDILKIQGLNISYENNEVVKDISFSIKKGEIIGIVGESGSGKSTLIKSIVGILSKEGKIDGGQIIYNGINIVKDKKMLESIRGVDIGMIFQDTKASLCPVRTIEKQLYDGLVPHFYSIEKGRQESAIYSARQLKKKVKKDILQAAINLMEKMNIKNAQRVLKSYPFELSGGMNQRVGIMMAMLSKPELLLADEPTSALDVITQAQVIEQLKNINSENNTAMIIVTHNMGVVRKLADKVIIMKNGNIVEMGSSQEIFNTPKQLYTKQLINAEPKLKYKIK